MIFTILLSFIYTYIVEMGYSSEKSQPTLDERRKAGAKVEEILKDEDEAAKAPID